MNEKWNICKNNDCICLLPIYYTELENALINTLGPVINIDKELEEKEIIECINNSSVKKIYLIGNNDFYRFLLPRLKKGLDICWLFKNSFSALSNIGVRYTLHCIFEFYDRKLISSIGCLTKENYQVLTNAGYNCELIALAEKPIKKDYVKSNTIGILSDDFDPNNNFYNQLAALTFLDYDYVKFKCVMPATNHFCEYFNIKYKKCDNIEDVIKDNFVNLYINFTNTNSLLIKRSFCLGIPCLVGNTSMFDKNTYLKEHLVIKSDDDVTEIKDKIEFIRHNRQKIIEEYEKM